MLFLIAIIVACLFSWFCAGALKKQPGIFYVLAAVLTVVMFALGQAKLQGIPQTVNTYVIGLFNRGALAAALWCVVAWIGALPNGSAPQKKLVPVRGELSIFAALVTLSHAVTWSMTYIKNLIRYSENAIKPSTEFVLTCIVCIALMLIMIPLTVLSFKAVRKKVKGKTWKGIQRFAYLFYALIYIHVMVIFLPRAQRGREGYLLSVLVYTAVFLGYAVFRIRKAVIRKKKPESKAGLNAACAAVFLLGMCGIGFAARPAEKVETAETNAPAVTSSNSETAAVAETDAAGETPAAAETAAEGETAASEEVTEAAAEGETEDISETADVSEDETQETVEASEGETEAAEQPAQEDPGEQPAEEQPQQQDEPAPAAEPEPQPEPEPEPEPQYIYNNGTFRGEGISPADGDKEEDTTVIAFVTIENDVITNITFDFSQEDPEYIPFAQNIMPQRFLDAQSADVDVSCGATRSAEGAREAVRNALDSARR